MGPRDVLKQILPPIVVSAARRRVALPNGDLYRPWLRYERRYSPWFGDAAFVAAYEAARPHTMIDAERAWVLWSVARQCAGLDGGDFVEAGVHHGGSALLIWRAIRATGSSRTLHLFDSFAGLPAPGPRDTLAEGEMSDTSVDRVAQLFDDRGVVIHPGWISDTLRESGVASVAFAHVDVDLEGSVLDACEFVYPRLRPGGAIVFDDYGLTCCPGARAAVDAFTEHLPETPLVLPTGQAVLVRLP